MKDAHIQVNISSSDCVQQLTRKHTNVFVRLYLVCICDKNSPS